MLKRIRRISPQSYQNFILIPIVLILICIFAVLIGSSKEAKLLSYKETKNTLSQQKELLNFEIRNINYESVSLIERNLSDLRRLEGIRADDAGFYDSVNNIIAELSAMTARHPIISVSYLYIPEENAIILNDGIIFPSSTASRKGEALRGLLHTVDMENRMALKWYMMEADKNYLCSVYMDSGYVTGHLLLLDNFLAYLQADTLEYDTIPYIIENEKIFLSSGDERRLSDKTVEDIMQMPWKNNKETDTVHFFLSGIGRNAYIAVFRGNGLVSRIETLLIITVVLTVIAILALMLFLQLYSRMILRPMEKFVSSLKNMDEEQWLNDTGSNNLLALEMANEEFRRLLRKIQSLRIDIYEKELERQKIDLQAMQLQVRPHFYISCLNLIHGFAEEANQTIIVDLTKNLSDYMRTLLGAESDMVTIENELELIRNYINIQHLHYGEEAFNVDIQVEGDMRKKQIPFMMIYNFIENSIWHNIMPGRCVNISLYVVSERIDDRSCIYIAISDDGKGFPQTVLQAASEVKAVVIDGKDHVGIYNSIRRLQYVYGDKAHIELSNMAENYGAVVEITIPEKREE